MEKEEGYRGWPPSDGKRRTKRAPAWYTSKVCRDKRRLEMSIKLMIVFSGKKTAREILGGETGKAEGICSVGWDPRFAGLALTRKF